MSRRRSVDPSIPVSIAIPRSLHTRLNELLAYKQSRSRWVCEAITAKVNAITKIEQVESKELCYELYNRHIIDMSELKLYLSRIKSMTLAEETVEEQ